MGLTPREIHLAVEALDQAMSIGYHDLDRWLDPTPKQEAKDLFTPLGYSKLEIEVIVREYLQKYPDWSRR